MKQRRIEGDNLGLTQVKYALMLQVVKTMNAPMGTTALNPITESRNSTTQRNIK